MTPTNWDNCMNKGWSVIDSSLGRPRSIIGNIKWLARIRLPHRKGNTMILAGAGVPVIYGCWSFNGSNISITWNLSALCSCSPEEVLWILVFEAERGRRTLNVVDCINSGSSLVVHFLERPRSTPSNFRWISRTLLPHRKEIEWSSQGSWCNLRILHFMLCY